MDTEKISKLALKLSIPMIISMLSMSIYNIIDTIFISKINESALTAISLCFPIQILISALAFGIGIGINSALAKSLGKKDEENAKNITAIGIILAIICYFLVIIVLQKNVLNKFFEIFTKKTEIINYGMQYLTIVVMFSLFSIFQSVSNKILEAYGKAKISMVAQFIGIVVNIILDPILIWGINGHLVLGATGAGLATIIGRGCGALFSISNIFINKDILKPKLKDFKPKKENISKIFKVSIPTTLQESVAPITAIVLNNILATQIEAGVTFYGIYYKTQSMIFMIVSGMNAGMIPIIAYNIGANKKERVKEAISLFRKASFAVTLIGTLVFMLLPNVILNAFNASQDVLNVGIPALRILAIGFIFGGQSFIVSAVFQGFGNGKNSFIIFLIRKVIVPFAIIFCLVNQIGLYAVWIGFTVAEILAYIYSVIVFKRNKI